MCKWPVPAWLNELPDKDKASARIRFYINLATAYHNEAASCPILSAALGMNRTAINAAKTRGKVSPVMANKIESLLGRENFPRELFNEVFITNE